MKTTSAPATDRNGPAGLPDNLRRIAFSIVGERPMMQHNGQLANPLNAFAKRLSELTSLPKRRKTDETYRQIALIEFEAGFYLDRGEDGKPRVIVPREWIDGMLLTASRNFRLGKQFEGGAWSERDWPLAYEPAWPFDEILSRTREGDLTFVDTRGVVVTGRVMRTRPIFHKWALDFEVVYDQELVNHKQVVEVVHYAGRRVGLSTYRPRFGLFRVVKPA
jgi:hypothetical protein